MESLAPGSKLDGLARLLVTAFFFTWNLYYGALIQTPYPNSLVILYSYPVWRLTLVLFLIAAIQWCPRVGMMVGLAVFFYFMDLPHFIRPWR